MPKLPTSVLAIDPATRCGWAISVSTYGTWNLKTRADESWGMKLIRFEAKLREILDAKQVRLIAYERPGGRNTQAIITQSKIIGIIERLAEENGIAYRAYSSSEIKKFATGKGNANKQKVIDAMRVKADYIGDDDNEADALALLLLVKSELNI